MKFQKENRACARPLIPVLPAVARPPTNGIRSLIRVNAIAP